VRLSILQSPDRVNFRKKIHVKIISQTLAGTNETANEKNTENTSKLPFVYRLLTSKRETREVLGLGAAIH
jgi:hypothetical protein